MDFYGNDLVLNEDHNLKINMENLRLRGDCPREENIRGSHQVSLWAQSSQFGGWKIKQSKRFFETVGKIFTSCWRSWKLWIDVRERWLTSERNKKRKFLTRIKQT